MGRTLSRNEFAAPRRPRIVPGLGVVVEEDHNHVLHSTFSAARNFHHSLMKFPVRRSSSDPGLSSSSPTAASNSTRFFFGISGRPNGNASVECETGGNRSTLQGATTTGSSDLELTLVESQVGRETNFDPVVVSPRYGIAAIDAHLAAGGSSGGTISLIPATFTSGSVNSVIGCSNEDNPVTGVAAGYSDSAFGDGPRSTSEEFRACFSSIVLAHETAVKLQAFYRGCAARKRYVILRVEARRYGTAAVKIQAFYKGLASRRLYLTQKRSAILIQASIRGWIARRHFTSLHEAAKKIQKYFLGRRSRQQFFLQRVLKIQAYYRGFAARLKLKRWNTAARRIQRHWMEYQSSPREQQTRCIEDWNTVAVEHLDQCLDTRVVEAAKAEEPIVEITPILKDFPTQTYKESLQQERRLQTTARVFLLQHHIALQQQRARLAPPFPPSYSGREYKSYRIPQEYENTSSGDVILDVECLLEIASLKGGNSGGNSMQSDVEMRDSFRQLNVLLGVFLAVVIYTKTICRGVLLWATVNEN